MNKNWSEMTEKEFKQAMLRGRGKCIFAALENPQKYFECVLWACENEVSLDPQCGSHSFYIYNLIRCYDDREPFLNAVLKSFENTRSDGGWKMLYLAELLNQFSDDGSERAKNALWDKYEFLLRTLTEISRAPDGIFPERDDFAMLCVVLAGDSKTAFKFAKDIGKLFRQNPIYSGDDFDWLYESKIKKFMSKIEHAAINDCDLACFVKAMRAFEDELNKMISNRQAEVHKSEEESESENKRLKSKRQDDCQLPKDEKEFVRFVKDIKVDFEETTDWHSVHCDVIGMCIDGYKVPAELLYYIYETTYCAECRNHAFGQLSRRRLLTEEMARECAYDCNEDTARLAVAWLKRRGIKI